MIVAIAIMQAVTDNFVIDSVAELELAAGAGLSVERHALYDVTAGFLVVFQFQQPAGLRIFQ